MIRATTAVVVAAVAAVLLAEPAHAQDAAKRFEDRSASVAVEIARRALDKTRRSLVLGPAVGVAETVDIDSGDLVLRGSLGLSLLRFDIPLLPTAESITRILRTRATERFLAQIRGKSLSEAEQQSLADQVWQDVVDEFVLKHRPRRFESPGLAVRLGARYLDAEGGGAWELGFSAGIGVGPVLISGGETVQLNNGGGLSTDFELGVPMALSRGLRSPTLELFLRASLANTGRDKRTDRLMLGARVVLDII